jgi:hypothetical protein
VAVSNRELRTLSLTASSNSLHSSASAATITLSLSLSTSLKVKVKVKVTLRLTISQSRGLGVEPHLGLMTRYLLLFDSYGLVLVGRPLWREDRSVFCICCWPLPAQFFPGQNPLVLATIFYCLRFEASLFVASYDSQGHGRGIRPRLHTGWKITVEVQQLLKVKVKVTLRLTVSQSVSPGVEPHLGLMTRYLLQFDNYGLVYMRRPLWREDRSVFCIVFLGSDSLGTRDYILLSQIWDFHFRRLLRLAGSRWSIMLNPRSYSVYIFPEE